MSKCFVIPYECVPSREQIEKLGIKEINIHKDLKRFSRPIMTIIYDERNDRVHLNGKIKNKHIKKDTQIIKGERRIFKRLIEIKLMKI